MRQVPLKACGERGFRRRMDRETVVRDTNGPKYETTYMTSGMHIQHAIIGTQILSRHASPASKKKVQLHGSDTRGPSFLSPLQDSVCIHSFGPTAHCDWRLPYLPPPASPAQRIAYSIPSASLKPSCNFRTFQKASHGHAPPHSMNAHVSLRSLEPLSLPLARMCLRALPTRAAFPCPLYAVSRGGTPLNIPPSPHRWSGLPAWRP